MKHFVILSQGAYSDYSPIYYYGDTEITQKELDEKSVEIGDSFMAEYLNYPERKTTRKFAWDENEMEKYNPKTGETAYRPNDSEYLKLLGEWLVKEKNYEEVGKSPEINVYYDIPTSKTNPPR